MRVGDSVRTVDHDGTTVVSGWLDGMDGELYRLRLDGSPRYLYRRADQIITESNSLDIALARADSC